MNKNNIINRRNFLSLSALAASSVVFPGCKIISKAKTTKPNIVLLLADDTGYGELGCYGQTKIKTPVLDRMAEEGIRFTDFYSGNTVCAPSRCCLMTGKDPGHATIRGNFGMGKDNSWHRVSVRDDELTLPQMLKKAGYTTGLIGKWHIADRQDPATWPYRNGFDYCIRRLGDKENSDQNICRDIIWVNGLRKEQEEFWKDEYVCFDDFATEKACEFVEQNQENPFFLFMSYKIPHAPESDLYDDEIYKEKGWPEVERRHAGRTTHLDRLIGVLMDKIKSLGLDEDTIFIYSSDNGPHNEWGHDHTFFDSNGPLKGYKRDLYEGGIRVPMIVRWKGKIKPGRTTSHIGAFWDIMPTFAQLAQVKPPKNTNGISFLPLLLSERLQQKHEFLYWEYQWYHSKSEILLSVGGGFRQAVRMGKWKGLRYSIDNPVELYDLENDISETKDVSQSHPEIVKKIKKIMETYRMDVPEYPYGGYRTENLK